MAEEKIIKNTIQIIATPSKVWDALVNPEKTKKYMFGCETVSDWKVGSSLLWKGEYNGQSIVFVKGNIIAIDPGKFLAYTVIDPNNNEIPDLPENYLTVTYSLIQEDHSTSEIIFEQGDFLLLPYSTYFLENEN